MRTVGTLSGNVGGVWSVTLGPAVDTDIHKTRPCVMILPPEIHDELRPVMVASITTGALPAPYRIALTFQGKRGLKSLDQLRTLD